MIKAEHLRCVTCGPKKLACGGELLGNYMVNVFCDDPDHPDEAPRKQPNFRFSLKDGRRAHLR